MFKKLIFETGGIPFDDSAMVSTIEVSKKIYSGKSKYQKIEIYDSLGLGKVLILDGVFQTSEKEEFIYHEMMAHLPFFYFLNNSKTPKNVLIIGGGDGGILEEVLKHKTEKVFMVEIDEKVISVSKKYLSSISRGAFSDRRTELIIQDGKKFIKNYKNFFDIIILDLSDPWGAARGLISEKFYIDVREALAEKGVISIQSGSFDCQLKLVSLISKRLKKFFPSVKMHMAAVPLYGSGEYSFSVAANFDLDKKFNIEKMKTISDPLKPKLRYWSPEIHLASAVLPSCFSV